MERLEIPYFDFLVWFSKMKIYIANVCYFMKVIFNYIWSLRISRRWTIPLWVITGSQRDCIPKLGELLFFITIYSVVRWPTSFMPANEPDSIVQLLEKYSRPQLFLFLFFFNWTLYFEIIVESHAIVRNHAVIHHAYFTQFPKVGTANKTVVQYHNHGTNTAHEPLILPRYPQLYL